LKLPTVMAKHHVKQNEKEKPHWSAEAWSQVRVEFRRAVALRSEALSDSADSSAYAERWTLWAHGTDHSGAEEWQQVPGIATEGECWASFARLQLTGVDADVVRTVVEGHETTAYYRDGTKYVVEFMCLPDTVDPRGPQGSGTSGGH
jgi:hypothetical protein